MITKILLFTSEHDASVGLKKLENKGLSSSQLSVLVADVEHSRLLNAETEIHIDLLSEIAVANRMEHNTPARDEGVVFDDNSDVNGLVIPLYAQQPTMQVPGVGLLGMTQIFADHEHGISSLKEYGLSQSNAEICLEALRDGQSIVCIHEQAGSSGSDLFHSWSLGFSESSEPQYDVDAAQILDNR